MCNRQIINAEDIRNLLQNNQVWFSPIRLAGIKKMNNLFRQQWGRMGIIYIWWMYKLFRSFWEGSLAVTMKIRSGIFDSVILCLARYTRVQSYPVIVSSGKIWNNWMHSGTAPMWNTTQHLKACGRSVATEVGNSPWYIFIEKNKL